MTSGATVEIGVSQPEVYTRLDLARQTGLPISVIAQATNEVLAEYPECFQVDDNGTVGILPDARTMIEERLPAPTDWISDVTLAEILEVDSTKVGVTARRMSTEGSDFEGCALRRRMDPESEPTLFMSAELAASVRQSIKNQLDRKAKRAEEKTLTENFLGFSEEMKQGETVDAEEFKNLIEIFGPDNCVDLLFQYRPDFKDVPVDLVSSFLTEYLGVFLIERGRLNLDNLSLAPEFLSNEKLKNSLVEVLKQHCLTYYQHEKRDNPQQDDISIISRHLDYLRDKIGCLEDSEALLEVLDAVDDYYTYLFVEIEKPSVFVESLTGDRPFPDLTQRINVGELVYQDDERGIKQKRRMLFADDPGMGKSASAIMAKEHVGAKCAVILSPGGMVETWKSYLSDRVGDNGRQIGYFKPGLSPNVLTVESPSDLEGIDTNQYDYIILSHGRLKPSYTDKLKMLGFDMLIVDEAHEFKNIEEGQKAAELISISDYVAEQDDSYTLMLTATPAPNKVGDIAMMLRLLYPGRFLDDEGNPMSNRELSLRIIKGDYIDLRTLLVPRMQRKLIADSIKMTELYEEYHELELSAKMEEIYEIYLEDDELTSSEKIQRLRQLLNNPATLDATPDVESVKAVAVGKALRARFKEEDKILMFVNDYVDNIISGENTIHSTLGLPENVKVTTLTGENKEHEREAARQEFQSTDEKMLLIVSGNIAGLGVDLSAADRVVFYNEPWNKSLRRQQIGRAYRPGREKPLYVDTFYFPKTLEEGMMLYTAAKDLAIKKLLHGIQLSELEQEALRKQEASSQVDESVLDVNSELAAYYYSSWQRMLSIFGWVKEIGEDRFTKEFLPEFGVEYARTYRELANRSYQANTARLNGTIIANHLDKTKGSQTKKPIILDIASGPEVLRTHVPEKYADSVVSLDANSFHFTDVADASPGQVGRNEKKPVATVAKMLELPIGEGTVDYVNMSLALHYTRQVIKRGVHERAQALYEINRVLKKGGRATLTMIYSLDFEDQEKMESSLNDLGFEIVERDSGEVESGENYKARIVTVKKVSNAMPADVDTGLMPTAAELPNGILQRVSSGLKLRKTDARVKDTRKIVDEFWVKGKQRLQARLNIHDREVLDEETEIMGRMQGLRASYGAIKDIPAEDIILNGFSRIFNGQKHVLFARLRSAIGSIILR